LRDTGGLNRGDLLLEDAVTLADLIRLNQLVRGRIDYKGFRAWYDALPPDGQRELAWTLCEFAHQAGVNQARFGEAVELAGLAADHPLVAHVSALCTPLWERRGGSLFELYDWVKKLPDTERPVVFRLFVFLFGVAEGRVYRGETRECCNHWWHRDLLDERVVRDLLNDPRFYMTAMKDDERIKGRS
jgi:hypothetical protein